jgi:hypothetical protein
LYRYATYKNVSNRFSVKYYLNLVLVDEEDRRYFKVGRYELNLVDPLLESARFQPLSLYEVISWFQSFAFTFNSHRYIKQQEIYLYRHEL